jgi:hypothetical protein
MTKKVFHVIETIAFKILIDYYSYHLDGFRRPKSLDVLKRFSWLLGVTLRKTSGRAFRSIFCSAIASKDVCNPSRKTRDSLLIIDNYLLLSHLD